MKKSAMNPYLPLYEYIPDGEPRIFGDRLYVYGSHDYAGGEFGFCAGDYMVWSAPLSDLSDWRCDGVAYPRSQCPDDLVPGDGMAAPDVIQGSDGRYYLYYNTKVNECHIAVSDKPEGPFANYGSVEYPDGRPYDWIKMFDPGVLVDDDGRIYLYIGFCMPGPVPEAWKTPGAVFSDYSLGYELASDMKTIVAGPVEILPGANVSAGTGFEGHAFFEASSPRKINGKYVMVYSSELSHEMAYALADQPLGPYTYAGALVSNADLGYKGNSKPVMPYGNAHGGLVELEGDWYMFYHRQTSGQEASRQGCAEKLPIREDGWFGQAEITSCGLNKRPLPAAGSYNACYCCHLTFPGVENSKYSVYQNRRETEPHIFEEMVDADEKNSLHYIANMKKEVTVGYKYFEFCDVKQIQLLLKGSGKVSTEIRLDSANGSSTGKAEISLSGGWETITIPVETVNGVHALYIHFDCEEQVAFQELTFR